MGNLAKLLLTTVSLLALFSLVAADDKELLGAGATFPYPLYSKMFDSYHKEYGVKVNFQAIGSGGGIRQLMNKTVDFGASDAFMSDAELKKGGAAILHIPICLGAVVVTYNLPRNPKIKFTPGILADIFLGKIAEWNDSRIKQVNPGIELPDMDIIVVHRSDGSGTTFIFTDYLSKISSAWLEKVSTGRSGWAVKGIPAWRGWLNRFPAVSAMWNYPMPLRTICRRVSLRTRTVTL
jgi:phosphate transport system substrate-binding protein